MIRTVLALFATVALSACATTRLHSQDELNRVALGCGMALGELVQEEDERRLLFVFRVAPTTEERACIRRWAERNRLHIVIIEAINDAEAS